MYPNHLRNLSPKSLLHLLNVYYVRDHQGQSYSGDDTTQDILDFISQWLTLEPEMRIAFDNYDPLDLIIGYSKSENSNDYFYQITGEDSSNFINNTERIFYLTHGYGRPNKYISPEDYQLRIFYSTASPTALIALSDIFGVCPLQQDPNLIRELFSDFNLKSINRFHQGAVKRITHCLGQETLCNVGSNSLDNLSITGRIIPQQCNQSKTLCFEEFLNSIGMLPIFDYDPFHNIFISNLSQLNQYSSVQPAKVWNFDEVRNLPDIMVASIIKILPDTEILKIKTLDNIAYIDTLDLSQPANRLRSRLVDGAIKFLIRPEYHLSGTQITYRRLVDDNMKITNVNDFIQSITKFEALIDPFDNPIDLETAEELNQILHNETLRKIIIKTRARAIENKEIIKENPELKIEDLKGPARKLILWSRRNWYSMAPCNSVDEWFPVAINFNEYFQLWSPLFDDIIKDTLKYYMSIF